MEKSIFAKVVTVLTEEVGQDRRPGGGGVEA